MQEAFLLNCVHLIKNSDPLEIQEPSLILSELTEKVFNTAVSESDIKADKLENLVWGGELPGFDIPIPCIQVNRPGLSGLQAVYYAYQSIKSGDLQIAAAGSSGIAYITHEQASSVERAGLPRTQSRIGIDAQSLEVVGIKFAAGAVIFASTQAVGILNFSPIARMTGLVQSRLEFNSNQVGLSRLINIALAKEGLSLEDIDIFAIDASSVGLLTPWLKNSGIDLDRINPDQTESLFSFHNDILGPILLCQIYHILELQNMRRGLVIQAGNHGDFMFAVLERI